MCDLHARKPYLAVRALNLDAMRRYLRGLENLCKEARITRDPRVVVTALRVLALAADQIWERK